MKWLMRLTMVGWLLLIATIAIVAGLAFNAPRWFPNPPISYKILALLAALVGVAFFFPCAYALGLLGFPTFHPRGLRRPLQDARATLRIGQALKRLLVGAFALGLLGLGMVGVFAMPQETRLIGYFAGSVLVLIGGWMLFVSLRGRRSDFRAAG